uniref:Uncharacterized protein n=1 Tax=Rhizophagus irregularis (strain DAOM 181602 / DAOM 197198 / MUCL 43194) TaxID=747089 RepID=U9TM12_RHIID
MVFRTVDHLYSHSVKFFYHKNRRCIEKLHIPELQNVFLFTCTKALIDNRPNSMVFNGVVATVSTS